MNIGVQVLSFTFWGGRGVHFRFSGGSKENGVRVCKCPTLELSWNLHLRFDFRMEGCTCLGGVGGSLPW